MPTTVLEPRVSNLRFEQSKVIHRDYLRIESEGPDPVAVESRRVVRGTLPGNGVNGLDIYVGREVPKLKDVRVNLIQFRSRGRVYSGTRTDHRRMGVEEIPEARLTSKDVEHFSSDGSKVVVEFLPGRGIKTLRADTQTGKVRIEHEGNAVKRALANAFGRNTADGVVEWADDR